MHETDDPYTVLGLTPTATRAEITHAYRSQLRALHPDTRRRATPGLTEASDGDLQRVVAAYTRLRTAAHRDGRDHAEPVSCTPSRARPVRIPIIYRHSQMPGASRPPLWAGPVREHD
jgi:curved DNA-binding protein CbpA